MIRTLLYRARTNEMLSGGPELLQGWQRESGDLLWMDLAGNPAADEAALMTGTLGLHPLAVQDAQRARHQPKIEFFEKFVFLLLKGLGPDRPTFEFGTIQIAIFIGTDFLVTRHSGPSYSIDLLWEQVSADAAMMQRGPDRLALALSRISVDRYLERLLTLEPRLEVLEHEIVHRPRDEQLAELLAYKTDLR